MSQVNHNYSYLVDVDGQTPWERLRIIRNFLMDRTKALKIAEAAQENAAVKKGYLKRRLDLLTQQLHCVTKDYEQTWADQQGEEGAIRKQLEILELEEAVRKVEEDLERMDAELMDHPSLVDDCRNELAFLQRLEQQLIAVTEPTRIPGYDDKAMYEVNFVHEARTRLAIKAECEAKMHGGISHETFNALRKDIVVMDKLISDGVLNPTVRDAALAVTNHNPTTVAALLNDNPIQQLGYKLAGDEETMFETKLLADDTQQ